MLAVPGVAGAHVKAKYRAEYKAKLTSLNKGFVAFAHNYDNIKQGSVDAAETMAPMIGDPNQHDQLVAQENWCLGIYNRYKGQPATWASAYGRSSRRSRARPRGTSRPRRSSASSSTPVTSSRPTTAVLVEHANNHVYESFRLLGMDPPAIEAAARVIADADEFAATGHEGWDKWLAALRALQ